MSTPPSFRPKPKVPPTGDVARDKVGAHAHSIDHREAVLAGETCGCFYCLATFTPTEITAWVDRVGELDVTALCPRCGIDSVIGSASGYPITAAFLRVMRAHWFASV